MKNKVYKVNDLYVLHTFNSTTRGGKFIGITISYKNRRKDIFNIKYKKPSDILFTDDIYIGSKTPLCFYVSYDTITFKECVEFIKMDSLRVMLNA